MARYAIGSIGTGGFATLPGLVLVYYMTDTLGVAALLAGLVVTSAKVWDVVIDPWIGAASDRALVSRGTRRTGMIIGGIALPIFFVLTFAVPAGLSPVASGAWVFVSFLGAATAFSLFQVPYIALPAELTSRYDARTRLLTWRVVVLTVAILLFGAGGPELRALVDDEYLGYLLMAAVAGVTISVGLLIASTTAAKRVSGTAVSGTAVHGTVGESRADAATGRRGTGILAGYRTGVDVLRESAAFRSLLATFVLQGLAIGLMLAGGQFVATWVLGDEQAVTLLFASLIAPAVLCAPLWELLARRIGKERAFAIASVIYVVASLALTAMLWAPGSWVYVAVAFAGVAFAGMQSLPMAMLPDVVSHDAATRGIDRAGSFGGVWTAGETAGMALGATLLTIVLAVTGYNESVGNVVATQSDTAVAGIVIAFSIVPAALGAASLVTLRRYPLRRADIDAPPVSPTTQNQEASR